MSTPPTPEQIDKLILLYEQQQDQADAAQAAADVLAEGLTKVVREFGTRPESAAQSIRLQGVHSEALVTMGVTRSLHEPSIQHLREYMKAQQLLRYFSNMFAESTKYSLIDGARDVLNGLEIPKRTREKVLQLFGMCITVKDQKPKLTIKAVKPVAPKKSRGKKAA
jgi:hypothetical protein